MQVVQIPPRAKTAPMTIVDYEDQTTPSNEIVQVARIVNRPLVPSTPPPPVERPLAAPVGVRKVVSIPPKTEPGVAAPLPPIAMPTVRATRPDTAPPTIIPIPKLPKIAPTKERLSQIQPVVSAAHGTLPGARPSRTRLAKGTGPVHGPVHGAAHVGVAPPPPIRSGEETSPGVAMPVAARAVALPSIKQRPSR